MKEALTFDDVLLVPRFSSVASRSEVTLGGLHPTSYSLPIISANMDTVTGVTMAKAMHEAGGIGCLHRFWSIEENMKAYRNAPSAWVSVGVGPQELERAKALIIAGAKVVVIDIAHGACSAAVQQYAKIKEFSSDIFLIVGNFGSVYSYSIFEWELKRLSRSLKVDGIKLGIGSGAMCTTRLKTGVGYPQFSLIYEFSKHFGTLHPDSHFPLVISDGGHSNSGDIAKALAAGADLVMLGKMLAGTYETPGEIRQAMHTLDNQLLPRMKPYRGSASKESYQAQEKDQTYITAEGEQTYVDCKGAVADVLKDIAGGLRSSLSYLAAHNLTEFRLNAEFIRITNAGLRESNTRHD